LVTNPIKSTISFTLFTTIVILVVTLNPFINILEHIGIDEKFIPIIVVITISSVLINILVGTLVSALKSGRLILPYGIGAISRFLVLIGIVYFHELSDLNIAWAYTIGYVFIVVILFVAVISFFKTIPGNFFHQSWNQIKTVFHASIFNWTPHAIGTIGIQFGIISTFAIKGASESGLFFIALAIFNVINMIPASMRIVNFPVMSGMQEIDRQKQLLKKSLKIGFLATMPIATFALFYGESILSLFGKEFLLSYVSSSILLIGIPLSIISDGAFYLIFARGSYRNVLLIGLVTNVSRIILYYFLVPEFGGMGTAIAIVIGYVLQLIFVVIILERWKIRLEYVKYVVICLVPLLIGFSIQYLGSTVLGIIPLLVGTLIVYLKLKLIEKSDIESVFNSMMNEDNSKHFTELVVSKLKQCRLM